MPHASQPVIQQVMNYLIRDMQYNLIRIQEILNE